MSIRRYPRRTARPAAAGRRRAALVIAVTLAAGLSVFAGVASGPLPGAAQAQPATTTTPFTTPNTDSCPNKTAPPPPIDTSEVPEPGQTAPAALPIADPAVGGKQLSGCGVILPSGAGPLPEGISATAWEVADLDTGKVIAAKDPHGRYRPASTIKVLLASVAIPALDLDKTVIGTQDDANADGTRVGIGPGGHYTNKQLFQALIMASGNDAAHAISTQLGGEDATVAKMNALAKQLQALDTRAATPSGLDGPGMSTSAYDLALLFRHAMTLPLFADLIHTEQVDFPGFPADPKNPDDKDHPGFPIANDNHLLYEYDGAIGGKTGYTDDARQTFVAAAQRNGHRYVVTLLKADVRPFRPWEQAAKLLDYAFALPAGATVGSMPDGGAGAANSSVALASPPARSEVEPALAADSGSVSGHAGLRTALMAGGVILMLALLLSARRLSRRR
ncbi:D-alanyl-D-alanine carboxypeptidase family protein [Nocardia niigatensis]|uniref:D-alanyl-D-alanine carboxypeptidase family protein n=1 Tax=Nocardia niigatensis TaxID=209249 RepID=UPI0002EE157C|nr:D-alanyl-D-alanine carboxypeptidase family protein [Nocardia niigatensis]